MYVYDKEKEFKNNYCRHFCEKFDFYSHCSVSGIEQESKLVRQKSRAALMSMSRDDQLSGLPGIAELNKNAKIKYFDGSGEDVTPVPLFVPPEPEEGEIGDGEEDGTKKKPRKNVMQTFLKVIVTNRLFIKIFIFVLNI